MRSIKIAVIAALALGFQSAMAARSGELPKNETKKSSGAECAYQTPNMLGKSAQETTQERTAELKVKGSTEGDAKGRR